MWETGTNTARNSRDGRDACVGSVGRKNVFCVLIITSWGRGGVCLPPLPTQHPAHGLCLLRRENGRFGCHLSAPVPIPPAGSVQPQALSPPLLLPPGLQGRPLCLSGRAPSLCDPCISFLFSLLAPSPFRTHQSLSFLKQTTSSQPQCLPFLKFWLPFASLELPQSCYGSWRSQRE